ncbi:hypothetical protein HIM_03596 [Hirsutella minnesotensis 3608]|uniref:Uncharacterized protein n=1 Tax=Hirsutella minnesotensis 3608 TaxID=1043627 RepID=A0A0F7ZQH8_9HYPO|nr:hypothetical protein HIM_03596 [Hirsutella minnesotensis 3608]
MSGIDFTPEARVARFREWVNVRSAPLSASVLSNGSNILLGAAMHGMARRAGGAAELTEIERMSVQFFDAMAQDEAEASQYGEICLEAKALARSGRFVAAKIPLSIMGLPEDVPYTEERFAEDFKELALETLAQPHIRAVTPDQILEDGTVAADEEYDAASTLLRRGVTVFADAQDLDPDAAADALPNWAWIRIKPVQFRCVHKSHEVGKDEVYFTWGFGSDMEAKVSHRTPEFGSVKNGVVRDFPQNPPLFSGYTNKAIAGHMVCWEADHSNSEWYDKLRRAMREIADKSAHMTKVTGDRNVDFLIGLIPAVGQVGEIQFWIENIANLVARLLDLFRNHDDKVVEHSYGWNRNLAESLASKNSTMTLDFNGGGGGHHTVTIQFAKS